MNIHLLLQFSSFFFMHMRRIDGKYNLFLNFFLFFVFFLFLLCSIDNLMNKLSSFWLIHLSSLKCVFLLTKHNRQVNTTTPQNLAKYHAIRVFLISFGAIISVFISNSLRSISIILYLNQITFSVSLSVSIPYNNLLMFE